MNWSRRSAYTSLELFLVHERRNVITPLAAQPTALSEAVGGAWPTIVSGGGLRTARKTILVAVGGGGGLGMLRRMTFFPATAAVGCTWPRAGRASSGLWAAAWLAWPLADDVTDEALKRPRVTTPSAA